MADASGEARGGTSFVVPEKRVKNVFDIGTWYRSEAYADYMEMLHKLNESVRGKTTNLECPMGTQVEKVIAFLDVLESWIADFPPEDMGSQRFGNKAFRKWFAHLEQEVDKLTKELLSSELQAASIELCPYLLDSFGNSTRIDYGSGKRVHCIVPGFPGHEAAFLIFLCCLFRLHLLHDDDSLSIVFRLFTRYLRLVRRLQETYRMEPAGSRGVHAIDDFQFVPYIWGSAQWLGTTTRITPESYTNPNLVEQHADRNLFFDAIRYTNKNKTGPFAEHSNQLWNISAVPSWEKVNAGLFKMYEGEVLKKFPVVQHFLFGSLFSYAERKKTDDDKSDNPC